MMNRREFLQVAVATSSLVGAPGAWAQIAARQKVTQEDLLRFDPLGQVTLLHFTDIHGQIEPMYFREPSTNLGVGAARGQPPHITGKDFLNRYGITAGTPEAYALSSVDFEAMARAYGRVGGIDRMATLVNAIRAERPDKTILLDGGDTWQGSYTTLKSHGADMVEIMNALGVDAMTGHWEFTLGWFRVQELIKQLKFPFLACNVKDTDFEDPVFEQHTMIKRGGLNIAVIGQAFPYTPLANPRHLIPKWSFGIREDDLRERVKIVQDQGADLVVLLSHNGFDVDRKLAGRIDGIDVILTGHTHDALPRTLTVGKTLLIASGCNGKFLSRLDLDIQNRSVRGFRYSLIPILSDVITPDPKIKKLVGDLRAPHEKEMRRVLGRTESTLYRRGNFNGTFDDLILDAIMKERNAEIGLSPGFRWGPSLIPGQDITVEDVYSQTAISYPNVYRNEFTGKQLKDILEDVADNLFNPDPYRQQGGDMVRVGGMSYRIDVNKPIGQRLSDMRLIRNGERIEASKTYGVAGWASISPNVEGPAVYDVVSNHIAHEKVMRVPPNRHVKIVA